MIGFNEWRDRKDFELREGYILLSEFDAVGDQAQIQGQQQAQQPDPSLVQQAIDNLWRLVGSKHGQADVAAAAFANRLVAKIKADNAGEPDGGLSALLWTVMNAWTGNRGASVSQQRLMQAANRQPQVPG